MMRELIAKNRFSKFNEDYISVQVTYLREQLELDIVTKKRKRLRKAVEHFKRVRPFDQPVDMSDPRDLAVSALMFHSIHLIVKE